MAVVSVVMPVYFEATDRLHRAIHSALTQDVEIELHLVADDGLDYSGRFNDRRIHHHSTGGLGRGPSVARNIGLNHCQGEWIAFLDSDDYFAARKLERLTPLASQYGVALDNHQVVFSDDPTGSSCIVAADTSSGLKDLRFCLEINNPIWPVFDRRCIGPARFLEGLHFSEDSLFNLTVIAQNNGQVGFLNENLHHYLVRADSLSRRGPIGDVVESSYRRILNLIQTSPLPWGTRRTLSDFYEQRIAINRDYLQWSRQPGHEQLSFQAFLVRRENHSTEHARTASAIV